MSSELYQQVILDHNKNPRGFRAIPNTSHKAQGHNPLCGDTYTVYLALDASGMLTDVSFEGDGCAISKASASMMTMALKGKSHAEAEKIIAAFHDMVTGKEVRRETLGKLVVLEGVRKYPARVKCAALSWHAAKAALENGGTVTTE